MCRARPLFKTAREKFFYGVRIELTEKADDFGGFRCGSGLQGFNQAMSRVVTQGARHVAQQLAILTESAVPKSASEVLQGGLRHQSQNFGHAIRQLAAAQRLFDEFRETILCGNAGTSALRSARMLDLDTFERGQSLMNGGIATFGCSLLAKANESRAN